MAGSRRLGVAALGLIVALPALAEGFGGHGLFRGGPSPAMYPARVISVGHAPAYCYPLPVAPAYAIVTPAPSRAVPFAVPFAVPTPAPPSQTAEPPLLDKRPVPPTTPGEKRGPEVIESRSLSATKPTPGRCRVGFWNLTGKDVTLTVDGQARSLPRDRALTLELDRQFTWQVDQRPAQAERVPEDQGGHEIVLRPAGQ